MEVIKGNIWDKHQEGAFICITVNCTPNSRGNATMGKGIAKQAVDRFPKLPELLGKTQIEFASKTGSFFTERSRRPQVFRNYRLITFPTKLVWWEDSILDLIEASCHHLIKIADTMTTLPFPIYLPKPGCENGGLQWEKVQPIVEEILDDRFIICDLK